VPTSTNTPIPTSTDTPVPTSTETPVPTSTNTPIPTSTDTPVPTSTETPVPTSTNTPAPTATPTFGEITPPPVQAPDLTILKTHTGAFVPGGKGTFTFKVTNVGNVPTSFPITVTDTLPVPLTLDGVPTGTGWNCGGSAGVNVVCTTNAVLGPNNSLPNITVKVNIGQTTLRRIENMAMVTTQNDTNPDNDTSTDIVLLQPNPRAAPSLSPAGIAFALLMLLSFGYFGLRRGLPRR